RSRDMRAMFGSATPIPPSEARLPIASATTRMNNPPTTNSESAPAAGSTAPSSANGSTTTATQSNNLLRGTIMAERKMNTNDTNANLVRAETMLFGRLEHGV